MNKNKKLGFTLAEVLIVIGIIGVVAALTLPNLNHATGDKEKVTKVKKVYSNLTEAVDRAQAIYGNINTWFKDLTTRAENSERFAKRVTEFMKVSKDCGFEAGCWSSAPYLDSLGEEIFDNYLDDFQDGSPTYMVVLSDGTSIGFGSNCDIRVDIDGPNKGKTQYGNDIFDFKVYISERAAEEQGAPLNQLIPSGNPVRWTGNYNTEELPGNYATAWVIENGNLDYLKCYDELNWETKTSCE